MGHARVHDQGLSSVSSLDLYEKDQSSPGLVLYAGLTCTNETISANTLGASSAFEEKGILSIRPTNPQQLLNNLGQPH